MAITSANPLVVNGVSYPNYAVQLIVSPGIEVADITARIVINLTPYRIKSDNTIEALPEQMRSVLISDAFVRAKSDPVLAEALGTVMYALQGFITAKGI